MALSQYKPDYGQDDPRTVIGQALYDLIRTIPCIVAGLISIYGSKPLALWVGEPAFAAWGLFIGAAFFAAALSHIMRRAVFPSLDLSQYARKALESPAGAGMVFLGVCIVISAFIALNGAMLRT